MMRRLHHLLMLALAVMVCLPVMAQGGKDLPRALVIGDTVYTQQARGLAGDLKGRAAVVMASWPESEVANSTTVLKHLDQLLGFVGGNGKPVAEDKRPAWDMIHINVGLGDLIHRMPDLKDFRVLPIHSGGVVATSPQQYGKNLDTLIKRLKATGAKIVWANTTPIRHSRSNVFAMGSEIEYNAIAAKVMTRHRVPTNDMYTYVKHLINMDKPAGHGFDPFNFDKKPIHMPVVRVIERAFDLKPMPETKEEQAVKEALAKPAPTQG